MLQDGDGVSRETALVRDARMLWGLGWLQLISQETFTDPPFGWKGRASTIAGFVEGGFQVHFGMASTRLVNRHGYYKSQGFTAGLSRIVGDGPDSQDPDSDGALDEVTMGEIAAVSLWLALQPSPVETQPSDPIRQQSAMRGRALMESLACTSCHTQHFAVTEPTYVVAGGIGGWDGREGLRVNLHEWAFGDQPAQPQPGAATLLPIWSDLRRHDMGPALADAHDTFRDDAPGLPTADGFATFFGRSEFLTTPLWGIAVTAPYLHDGRAPTIRDAILAHGGEANESLSKFLTAPAADQQAVLDLLDTFTWFEAPLP